MWELVSISLIIYILIICNTTLLRITISKKEIFKWVLILTLLSIVIYSFSRMIAGYFVLIGIIVLVHGKIKSWAVAILCGTYFMLLGVLWDNTLGFVITSIFKVNLYSETPSEVGKLILLMLLVVDLILLFCSAVITRKTLEKFQINPKGLFKSKYVQSAALMMVVAFVPIFSIVHLMQSNIISDVVLTIGIAVYLILVSGIILLLFHGAYKDHQKNCKEIEFQQLKEYTDNVEFLYKDIRKFKHDYVNILSSMAGYMETDDMKGLINYFDQTITPYSSKLELENYRLGILSNMKVTELKGILSTKIIQSYQYNLQLNIEMVEPIERIDIDTVDLCRMVGILLDNAIEAAKESEKKILDLVLIKHDQVVTIIISNSFPTDSLPFHKLYVEGLSSKGRERGHGLSNFKELANSYKNVLTETNVENGYFTQIIRIENKAI